MLPVSTRDFLCSSEAPLLSSKQRVHVNDKNLQDEKFQLPSDLLTCSSLLNHMKSVSLSLSQAFSKRNHYGKVLKQLFSHYGKNFVSADGRVLTQGIRIEKGKPYNVRMEWIRTDKLIKGIFIRIYSENTLEAHGIHPDPELMKREGTTRESLYINTITVDNNRVIHNLGQSLSGNYAKEFAKKLVAQCFAKGSEDTIEFHPRQFNYYKETVELFFEREGMTKHDGMLPDFSLPQPYHLNDGELQDDKLQLLKDLNMIKTVPRAGAKMQAKIF